MRVALLLLVVLGCSKKAAEPPRAEEPASAPAPAVMQAPAPPPPAAEAEPDFQPKGGAPPTGAAPKLESNAREEARTSGVLGPTDRAAFEVRGKVTIKTANKSLDEAFAAKRDALQACYDKALEFQEKLAGELTLQVAGGKLAVTRSTVKNADLEKCVLDALAGAALPKGKASVTLAFTRE